MKLGMDDFTFQSGGLKKDPFLYIDETVRLGLKGIHFSIVTDVFESMDEDYLKRVGDYAGERGLYLEFGMGTCNPLSNCRAGKDVGREPVDSLRELLLAASIAGASAVRTVIGALDVRSDRGIPKFGEHLAAAKATIDEVKGLAEEIDVKIAIENHLDLTSSELAGFLEEIGSPAVGCCFDTGNQVSLLEDNMEACLNLLPYICSTHFKDCALIPWEEGALMVSVPLGEGMSHLTEVVRLIGRERPDVNLSIEDHWEMFPVPVNASAYTDTLPHYSRDMVEKWLAESKEKLKNIKDGQSGDISAITSGSGLIADRIADNVKRAKRIVKEVGMRG